MASQLKYKNDLAFDKPILKFTWEKNYKKC